LNGFFAPTACGIPDVEELTTHGGSLRYYGCHLSHSQPESPAVEAMREKEKAAGLDKLATYAQLW
jgi:hypothetical protein